MKTHIRYLDFLTGPRRLFPDRSINLTEPSKTRLIRVSPSSYEPPLREIVLRLKASPNWMSDISRDSPTTVRILDCKPGREGGTIQQLVELNTPDEQLEEIVKKIRKNPMVTDVYVARTRMGKSIGRVLSREALACGSVMESNLFCRSCLFAAKPSGDGTVEWTLAFSDGTSLTQFLNKLESVRIKIEIRRLSKVLEEKGLTPRQHQIILKALDKGYFDYPRRMDLSTLAKELGITKSTLLEILRRAEKKALTSLYGSGLGSNSAPYK